MPAVAISNFFHRTTRSLQGAARHRAGPIELLAIPAPLRLFDDAFLPEWADGRFALAGHSVPLQGNWPFDIRHAPAAWRQAFRGFGWLRHVPASVEPDGERRVQSLIAAWLRSGSSRSAEALADDVVARRIMSWLAHADLLLQTPDARFYDSVLQALSADVALLERRWRTIESGYVRLISLIALAQAGLCLSNGAAILQTAETALVKEVTAHAMAPSSALIRDPDAVAELLLDLEPLRLLYKTRQRPLPPLLAIAIVNIRRSLAGVLLGDGSPARLGNARRGPNSTGSRSSASARMAGTGSRLWATGAARGPSCGARPRAAGWTIRGGFSARARATDIFCSAMPRA